MQLLGRLTFPMSMLAFPFYLLNRSPGKEGSHYDPKTDMFSDLEAPMVRTPHSCSHPPPWIIFQSRMLILESAQLRRACLWAREQPVFQGFEL